MAQTPMYVEIDVRTIPEIRELLERVWDQGFWQGSAIRNGDKDRNPYRREDTDAD